MYSFKTFWHGEPIESMYPGANFWEKCKFGFFSYGRKGIIAGIAILFLGSSGVIGFFMQPEQVHADVLQPSISTSSKQKPYITPVLERIAHCESSTGQFGPSGQVVMRPNTNGTVDVGEYQINTVWFKKATELGFDVTTEDGNERMAIWIYENKGTGDWSASQACWSK